MSRPLLCRSDGSLQSLVSLLHRQGLSVSFCIETLRDLFPALAFASALAVFALAFPLRMYTDLYWQVHLCSRDLDDFLSHLCPARDPCAVPDEVRFDPHVLHTSLGVLVGSFRRLTLKYETFERCQLCRYVVCESVRQHVHQKSNKLWLPFHHELSPGLEPFFHACIVALVQCWSCRCHHEYVVHLCAEATRLTAGRRVESRHRFQLIPLFHGSEVWSQIGQPIRVLHRISFNLVWYADHLFSFDNSAQSLCGVRSGTLNLSCKVISLVVAIVPCCWSRTFNCWTAAASGVDMVTLISLLARGATRRAQPLCWYPRLIQARPQPLSDGFASSWPAWHQRLLELSAPRFPMELSAPPDNKSRFQCSAWKSRLHYHDVGAYSVTRLYMPSLCAQKGAAVSHNIKSVRVTRCAHMRRKTWLHLELCVSSRAHILSQPSFVPWNILFQILKHCHYEGWQRRNQHNPILYHEHQWLERCRRSCEQSVFLIETVRPFGLTVLRDWPSSWSENSGWSCSKQKQFSHPTPQNLEISFQERIARIWIHPVNRPLHFFDPQHRFRWKIKTNSDLCFRNRIFQHKMMME